MLGQAEAHILGYVVNDPTLVGTSTKICRLRIGVDRTYKDKKYTEYFMVVAFGERALFYVNHLVKGDQISVVGPLRTNKREVNGLYFDEVQLQVRELVFLSNLKVQREKEDREDYSSEEILKELSEVSKESDARKTVIKEEEDEVEL
jgi:single-stranded DNA-binding protein